jgi:enamine deaminase RidA (YjgF/YER057c/UK114 family)
LSYCVRSIKFLEVRSMKTKIEPASLLKPVGTYSHVVKVKAGELVFVAGQIPVNSNGDMVGLSATDDKIKNHRTIDLAAQVRQAYLNLRSALEAAGATMNDIVRLDTYVVMNAANEYGTSGVRVRREMLGSARPPGATVFVAGLMPPEALIEISAIAAID